MSMRERLMSRLGLAPASQMAALQREVVRLRQARSSGVEMNWRSFDYEDTAALKGSKKWDTLNKMENDPHVKGALRVNILPLLTAEWEIRPASDEPKDEEVAEFVSANLLRTTGDKYGTDYWTQTSWTQRLNEILQMLRDGFSMFSPSFRRVGSKLVYDRIQWLEPGSVDPRGWILDDIDNIVSIERTYTTPTNQRRLLDPLRAKDIALYVWDLKGARFEGRPMIRSMYGPWYRKDLIQRWALIWAQKVGAPPPMGHYPGGWTQDVRDEFEDFIKSLRGEAPADAWGMFPMSADGKVSAEVGYAGGNLDVERGMTSLIDTENAEIAHTGNTKSDLLGETQSGSRALGLSQSQREMQGVSAVSAWVREQESHGTGNIEGLIERLVRLNFAGVKRMPELVSSKIDASEGIDAIEFLIPAVTAGLVPRHPALRRQVTERFGFELPDDAYEIEDVPVVPNRTVSPPDAETEPGSRGDDRDMPIAASLESRDAFRARIAPLLEPQEGAPAKGAGFRRPNRIELEICNLAAIQDSFRLGERDILTVLRGVKRDMIEEVMRRLRAGKIEPRNLESQRRSKFRGQAKAENALREVFREVGRRGVEHVDDELKRQRGR